MQSIVFECEIVTPMFLGGADGKMPELRAPSLKGMLRFWWRAMNGHLTKEQLAVREGAIFGDTTRRSCFSIQIKCQQKPQAVQTPPVPHKPYAIPALAAGTTFQVVFTLMPVRAGGIVFDRDALQSLFEIVVLLGGLGKRVRRGMGAYKINRIDQTPYPAMCNAEYILGLLHRHSPHYTLSGGVIVANYPGNMLPYGWIHRIEIGAAHNNITRKISDTTHKLKNQYGNQYEPNLGHATNGRFASPVYVSVSGDGRTPIITTLNTVPDKGRAHLDLSLQETFKSALL